MAAAEPSAKWQEFRKSKLGLVFGLVLTALLSLVLLLYGGYAFCLTPILVAMILYFLPRYFGLKDKKKGIVFGVIMLVLIGLVLGFTFYTILKDFQPALVSSPDGRLTDGQVMPFRGGGDEVYNFSVVVSIADPEPEVWVTTYDYIAGNQAARINLTSSFNVTGGDRAFYEELTPAKSIYRHEFSVRVNSTTVSTTSIGWGPFMVSDQDMLLRELYYNTLYVVINVGIWFAFIFLGAWWMDSSKKRMQDLQKRKQEEKAASTPAKEKFVCSECGSDVPGDAKECPQCGEKFDD